MESVDNLERARSSRRRRTDVAALSEGVGKHAPEFHGGAEMGAAFMSGETHALGCLRCAEEAGR